MKKVKYVLPEVKGKREIGKKWWLPWQFMELRTNDVKSLHRDMGAQGSMSQGPLARPHSQDVGSNLPAAQICFLANLRNPS